MYKRDTLKTEKQVPTQASTIDKSFLTSYLVALQIARSVKAVFWTLSIVYIFKKILRFGSRNFFRRQVKRKDRTLAVGPSG
jgi:hypothetical protein